MVAIIGNGNVAFHLFQAFKEKTEVILVNSHTMENFPENPDFVMICVSDDAINAVSKKIPDTKAIIAHTSGCTPMDILNHRGENTGVFYPLQTFSKEAKLNYKEIPVFIEGRNPEVVAKLKKLASLFSDDIREVDSFTRKRLHLSSVIACNFTNALMGIAHDILSESGIDYSVLLPLMKHTIEKLNYLSPKEAQTGPAVRGDSKVIKEHIKLLEDKPEFLNIYSLLTKYIETNNVK